MWRILFTLLVFAGAVANDKTTLGQGPREPYGPFDAIAEGARNSELQRLSAIDAQLDTVDALRAQRVAQPRVLLGRPDVAVYPYGRRGILGLRPRGYVVVRRTPVVVYGTRSQPVPPPPPAGYEDRYYDGYASGSTGSTVRQPIGHESLQTGPNRWEYRPLYADDERALDSMHSEIERTLRPAADADQVPREPQRTNKPGPGGDLEELPVPSDDAQPRQAQPAPRVRGQARDIARSAAFAEERRDTITQRRADDNRRDVRVPPAPQPDPPDQSSKVPHKPAQTTDDAELRGPLLQIPSTGAREF
jgi:hypothetical protein